MPASSKQRLQRYHRWSWGISCLLHASVLGFILAQAISSWLAQPAIGSAKAGGGGTMAYASPEPLELSFPEEAFPTETPALASGAEMAAQLTDPAWQDVLEPIAPQKLPAASDLVASEVMRAVAAAEQRSVEENQHKLDELADKLSDISSEKAVGDINDRLNQVFGTEARAAAPVEGEVAGEFEFDTAQIHDVRREQHESGNMVYIAILVDSSGRKFESPLSASEGEQLYRTLQIIKKNPLLEKVYRGVVMSLMDKVLKGLAR